MAEYTNAQAMAARLIAQKGFSATIRAADTPTDPVTGLGGSNGATRSVDAVRVRVGRDYAGTELAERATCVLICDAAVQVNETWVDAGKDRPIIAVEVVQPDNSSHVITKAFIGA